MSRFLFQSEAGVTYMCVNIYSYVGGVKTTSGQLCFYKVPPPDTQATVVCYSSFSS